MSATARILTTHGKARRSAELLESMRQVEHSADRLAASIRTWARRVVGAELARARIDPMGYLRTRRSKQQEPPPWMDPGDLDLATRRFGFSGAETDGSKTGTPGSAS